MMLTQDLFCTPVSTMGPSGSPSPIARLLMIQMRKLRVRGGEEGGDQ